jgi:hypothetical protein
MSRLGVWFVSFCGEIEKLPQIWIDLRELIIKSRLGYPLRQPKGVDDEHGHLSPGDDLVRAEGAIRIAAGQG